MRLLVANAQARRRRRRTSGMTLMELLAAMAIFLGLAGMILQVLGGGLDLWSTGERTRDESETAAVLLDRLSAELRHAVSNDGGTGEPRVRMLCDFVSLDADGDGSRDFRAPRLLFVRSLFEERSTPALRRAGTTSGALVPFTGIIDSNDAEFLATEGRTEVAIVPQPDPRAGYEGRMVLWRALQSPVGGAGMGQGRRASLFELALKDEGGLNGAELEALAENVLYFSVSFIDPSVQDVALGPDAGGPLVLWDSTRGVLPPGEGFSGFRHGRGRESLADPDDDVFPEAVRIAVVVTTPPGESPTATTVGEIAAGTGTARVDIANGFYLSKLGAAARELKIGHEWVEAAESNGSSLTIVKRGLHGTAAVAHPEGSKVLVGRRFERVIPLPAARFDLISRDLQKRRP